MDKEKILNSIFYPRKYSKKDKQDILIDIDKDKIAIRLFLKKRSYPTILFFHGNAEICQDYDDIAMMYNNSNINLIVSDYRGYGLSTGAPSKQNLHSDSIAVFDYVLKYLSKNSYSTDLFVMGRSLGSASASHLMFHRQEHFKGAIIESGFATEFPLLHLMNIDPESISYKLSDGFNNLSKIQNYKKPILVIHSDLDDIIPFSQAELILIECKSKNKNLFKIEGANHNNIIMISRNEYFTKIKSFIESV